MLPTEDARQSLALRLKALREAHWPSLGITQLQLAKALGGTGRKSLGISSISSWESTTNPAVPPVVRLEAYATFFATQRSCESKPYRVLPIAQLSREERQAREELLRELTSLRAAALRKPVAQVSAEPLGGGLFHFPDLRDITIVCAPLPAELRAGFSYADPASPDFVELYTYADPDALIELYGHLRSINPLNQVNFKTASELQPDDYTTHLFLLGGVDWNSATKDVLGERVELPVRQLGRHRESEVGGFEVQENGETRFFAPKLNRQGQLIEDVVHFYHGPNPFNSKRTVTICNGMYGRGTLGAVRALTDVKFRDRNGAYASERLTESDVFSLVCSVSIVGGQVLTPDWTEAATRLHEWTQD